MARWARARDEYGRLVAAIGGGGQDQDGCANDEAADHQDRDRGEHGFPLVDAHRIRWHPWTMCATAGQSSPIRSQAVSSCAHAVSCASIFAVYASLESIRALPSELYSSGVQKI